MKYGILFSMVSILLAVTAIANSGWHLLIIWPALSFAIVASGYLGLGAGVYGKSSKGTLSAICTLLLLPYLLYMWGVWYGVRLVKSENAIDQVIDGLFIGRRVLSHEFPVTIDHVIDLTCEFNEPGKVRTTQYHSFQILDGSVVETEKLLEWARQAAAMEGNLFIHCAEGHGRTGLFAALLLLVLGKEESPESAIATIKKARPQVGLSKPQMNALIKAHEQLIK